MKRIAINLLSAAVRSIAGDLSALELVRHTDWAVALPLFDEQGLSPLVYPLVKNSASVPVDVVARLRRSHEDALLHADLAAAVLAELRPGLAEGGRVTVLKGLALVETAYDPGSARPMSDVDLLLSPRSIGAAARSLAAAGFERYRDYPGVWRRGGITLDLHDDPWDSGRVPARAHGRPVLDFVESAALPGYLLPAPRSLAAHTAFHAAKHGLARGVWLADLAMLYKKDMLRHGVDACADACIDAMAASGFLPPSAGTSRGGPRYRCAVSLLGRRREHDGEVCLALLMPTASAAVSYIVSSAVPRQEILEQMYGRRPKVVLVLMRLAALVARIFRSGNKQSFLARFGDR
jgi:hypothetical protein